MVRPHKAAASPLCQVPTEPRTHRQDGGKKGPQYHRAVVANGELVSPAGSSRYLLSGCAGGAGEIQEAVTAAAVAPVAPVGDAAREEPAADVKNANTQEQVRKLCCLRCESLLITTLYLCFGALFPLILIPPPTKKREERGKYRVASDDAIISNHTSV